MEQQYFEVAKSAVEIAIEQDEDAGLNYIRHNTPALNP